MHLSTGAPKAEPWQNYHTGDVVILPHMEDSDALTQIRKLEERKPARDVLMRQELRDMKNAIADVTRALQTQNEILLSLSKEYREAFHLDSAGQVRPTRIKPPSHKKSHWVKPIRRS